MRPLWKYLLPGPRTVRAGPLRPIGPNTTRKSFGNLKASLILLFVASMRLPMAHAQQPSTSEYQVEAAYLYHFAEFVAWPAEAFSSPDAPITIGLVNGDAFSSDLEATIRN